jgi:hypothetical protein
MHHFESASKQAGIALVSEDNLLVACMMLMHFSASRHE